LVQPVLNRNGAGSQRAYGGNEERSEHSSRLAHLSALGTPLEGIAEVMGDPIGKHWQLISLIMKAIAKSIARAPSIAV
jgi:hypothetical protein